MNFLLGLPLATRLNHDWSRHFCAPVHSVYSNAGQNVLLKPDLSTWLVSKFNQLCVWMQKKSCWLVLYLSCMKGDFQITINEGQLCAGDDERRSKSSSSVLCRSPNDCSLIFLFYFTPLQPVRRATISQISVFFFFFFLFGKNYFRFWREMQPLWGVWLLNARTTFKNSEYSQSLGH